MKTISITMMLICSAKLFAIEETAKVSISVYKKCTERNIISDITDAILDSKLQSLLNKKFEYDSSDIKTTQDEYLAQLAGEIYDYYISNEQCSFEPLLREWFEIIKYADLPEYYNSFLFAYAWRKTLHNESDLTKFEVIAEAYKNNKYDSYNKFYKDGWLLEMVLPNLNNIFGPKREPILNKRHSIYDRETAMREILRHNISCWPNDIHQDRLMRYNYYKSIDN